MIRVKQRGNFNNIERFINKVLRKDYLNTLDDYGQKGLEALKEATPIDSGKTKDSWRYRILFANGKIKIQWYNTNIVDGAPIAIILQYGHATRNGGFVQGVDYINPAMRPIFEQMADEVWGKVIE